MIKRVLSLAVFLLVINAGVRAGVVFFRNEQFKDAVREVALFGANKSDEMLKAKVMELATENQVPLDPDFVEITRSSVVGVGDHVIIKVSYATLVPLIPGKPRRFQFDYATP
jgi:hypothetical protein